MKKMIRKKGQLKMEIGRFLVLGICLFSLFMAFFATENVYADETGGKTIDQLGLEDGIYTMPVLLEGGSIGAAVTSPVRVQIKEGKMIALVEWDSVYYKKMIVNGASYEPEKREGNAKFKIPVERTDAPIQVAYILDEFGTATQINCSLTFYSAGIEKEQPRVSKGYAYGSAAISFLGVISLAALVLVMIHHRMNKSYV